MNYFHNLFIAALSAILIAILTWVGSGVSRRLGLLISDDFDVGNVGISIVVGNTLLSLVLIPFMMMGGLTHWHSVLIVIIFAVIAIFNGRHRLKIKDCVLFESVNPFRLFFALVVLLHALNVALPEVSWDALAYHLPVTDRYQISTGAGFYSAMPKGMDVLFWFGESLFKNYTASKMFTFSYLIAMALFAYSLMKLFSNQKWARFTILLFLLYHTSFELGHICYVDIATACSELLAIGALLLWMKSPKQGLLNLMALGLGSALAIKYTALFTTFIFAVFFLLIIIFSKGYREKLNTKVLLLPTLIITAVGGFWYIKNWIALGNPVWPFYFGHRDMSDEVYQRIMKDNLGHFTVEKSFFNLLLTPARVFLGHFQDYSFSLNRADSFHFAWRDAEPGVAAALLLIFSKKFREHKELLGLLCFYFLVFIFNFYFGSHQTRYILSNFYLGIIWIGLFAFFCLQAKTKLQNVFFVFLLLFSFFQGGRPALKPLGFFHESDYMQKFMNGSIYDYSLVYYQQKEGLPTEKCGYMFEVLSLRYFENHRLLRNGYELKLNELGENISYEKLKNQLKAQGVVYWLSNIKTLDYRKDWLKRITHMEPEDRKQLEHMVLQEELILKNAKLLRGDQVNRVFEL